MKQILWNLRFEKYSLHWSSIRLTGTMSLTFVPDEKLWVVVTSSNWQLKSFQDLEAFRFFNKEFQSGWLEVSLGSHVLVRGYGPSEILVKKFIWYLSGRNPACGFGLNWAANSRKTFTNITFGIFCSSIRYPLRGATWVTGIAVFRKPNLFGWKLVSWKREPSLCLRLERLSARLRTMWETTAP